MNAKQKTGRNLWVDYLRSSITVLVVAHHSSLAYTTFARFDKTAYINSTHPIVDTKRWLGLDIFENYNDIFFMYLMFFIGGLFLYKSIEKKGTFTFIKDRVYRLFFPFIFGGTLLMLIAYFPSYYVAYNSANIIGYVRDFFTTEKWPVGPPWFIWVLFFYNAVFAFSYFVLRNLYKRLALKNIVFQNKPVLVVLFVFALTWILYVPVAYKVGAGTWTGIGPFDFQLSRFIAYFGYFMLGTLVGATDFNHFIFSENSLLVKRWKLWAILSVLLYTGITLNGVFKILDKMVDTDKVTEFNAWMIYYSIYVACCTITSFAFIGFFRSAVHTQKKWWDSLSKNAYLIYLTHFVFIVWTQFALLNANIPAFTKFLVVFFTSLALSWGVSILLRKINIVSKYL